MQSPLAPSKSFTGTLPSPRPGVGSLEVATRGIKQFWVVIGLAFLAAAAVNQLVAVWIGLPKSPVTYRRIGPQAGPQVFCAGSSLLQFAISWPALSQDLGRGIENWGIAGSSPLEWEVYQPQVTNASLMIIGASLYDLNENHLCDSRADIVPLTWTIEDLFRSHSGWAFAKRSLSQYPLSYLRKVFPAAGKSDAVLVGLRRKLPEGVRAAAAAEDRANSLVVPREAVLNFGDSSERLSDWPASKKLRRLTLMRSENRGQHAFNGPKQLAFRRMLDQAQKQGSIIVVVLPVAPAYKKEFLTPEIEGNFEQVLAKTRRDFPQALVIRLDQIEALNSDEVYSDPVHLNSFGRQIATAALFEKLKEASGRR